MLCAKTWPNWVGMPKEGVKEMFKVLCNIYPSAKDVFSSEFMWPLIDLIMIVFFFFSRV